MLKNVSVFLFITSVILSCSDTVSDFSEGYVLSQGDSIYYKTIGQGEPIIIVHGGPVLDHTYLLEHFGPLAKNHQLVFYDQRACGTSQVEIPSERMTFSTFVDDIETLRISLGFEKISLLGHSWGGLIAMKYAIAHDEQLNKLILSNSMAPSAKEWDRENIAIAERYSEEDQDQLNKLASSGLLRSKDAGAYIDQMMMLSYKSQFYDLDYLDKLHLNIPNDYALRSSIFMNLSKEMVDYDLTKELEQVNSPTMILYGEIEPAVGFYLSDFVNTFPNAQSRVIERSGHFPFIEQSGLYFGVLSEFLDQ